MAKRNIYIPLKKKIGIEIQEIEFEWFPGLSKAQKQRSIRSLHMQAKIKGIFPILEVSSKSETKIGVDLSAFNLSFETSKNRKIMVENAFQGSKVFENGGPYIDLYSKSPIEAKKDLRLKKSGRLIKFRFYNEEFELKPRTFFYDWLYIKSLSKRKEFYKKIIEYSAFSDIEFNPEKSINCQAYSLALFVSLYTNNVLDLALSKKEDFLELTRREYEKKDKLYQNLDLLI